MRNDDHKKLKRPETLISIGQCCLLYANYKPLPAVSEHANDEQGGSCEVSKKLD